MGHMRTTFHVNFVITIGLRISVYIVFWHELLIFGFHLNMPHNRCFSTEKQKSLRRNAEGFLKKKIEALPD
jgi:hypothetical protein